MAITKVLAMVLAGGEGTRLHPLTAERSKPAVPFAGRYRIVDFVLSNLANSGVNAIYLLVQYKSQSLIEHVRKAWVVAHHAHGHFVTVVPPQMRGGPEWFQGTADAVFQNLGLVYRHRPDVVAVFGSDHIYRMDVNKMVRCHLEHDADVTVAALRVPLSEGRRFGVMVTDADGRVRDFQEKPERPAAMSSTPGFCYVSMGNYLFRTDVLLGTLEDAHAKGERDFGRDVLPHLTSTHRVCAYDFASNVVPGVKAYEEQAYWRDVGNIETYFEAHQDVLGFEPRFDLFNRDWPIYSDNHLGPSAQIIAGEVVNSIVGGASVINRANVRNSVIRREVVIEPGAEIEDSIVMDYTVVGRGSRLRRTIVDRYNIIDPDTTIGYDPASDAQRYHVSSGGIVVVPKGTRGLEPVY